MDWSSSSDWIPWVLSWLALPEVGLGAVFVVSFLAATVLPLGSEPFVAGYVALNPGALWPTVFVATLGNTLGGLTTFWVGRFAHDMFGHAQAGAAAPETRWRRHAHRWVERFGPAVLLLSWVPAIGDPLCAVAGWLRLPLWRCAFFMAAGKCARYVAICGAAAMMATR